MSNTLLNIGLTDIAGTLKVSVGSLLPFKRNRGGIDA